MAQAYFCTSCKVAYTAELSGRSCPACGNELIHGRIPAGASTIKRSRTPQVSRAVWDHIVKKDPCAYCGDCKSTTIDHILPKALGGSKGSWTNRAGSCFQCNQDKAHTPLLFFMLQQRGENIDFLLDEDGRWPIPDEREEIVKIKTEQEELTATVGHTDPRKIIGYQPTLDRIPVGA